MNSLLAAIDRSIDPSIDLRPPRLALHGSVVTDYHSRGPDLRSFVPVDSRSPTRGFCAAVFLHDREDRDFSRLIGAPYSIDEQANSKEMLIRRQPRLIGRDEPGRRTEQAMGNSVIGILSREYVVIGAESLITTDGSLEKKPRKYRRYFTARLLVQDCVSVIFSFLPRE